jgi:hypothetical protein
MDMGHNGVQTHGYGGTISPTKRNGEIIIGETLIRTLRRIYGAYFAEGCRSDEKASRCAAQIG